MKRPAFRYFCALFFAVLFVGPAAGKPPRPPAKDADKKPASSSSPAPAGDVGANAALARWLMQAPSGADAIVLPFAQVAAAATGKRALPFDPGNVADTAMLSRLGAALDALLPRMNLPDSPAKVAASPGGAGAAAKCFEEGLRTLLPSALSKDIETADHAYPALKIADASGRMYCLSVTLHPTNGETTVPSLHIRPDVAAIWITEDGCCLLVGIEHNGKPGRDIAFLNWQILDLAKLKVRYVPTFQASGQEVLQPGAVLTDGRKGRD